MDKLRLEYEIKKQGLSLEEFCDKIGMSRSAFYRKCNGLSDFTLSEMNSIINELGLKSPVGIFFTPEVSNKTLQEAE